MNRFAAAIAAALLAGCAHQAPPAPVARLSVDPGYNRGWKADPATEAEIARRDAAMPPAPVTSRFDTAAAQCDYEAHVGALGIQGILMQVAEEANLQQLCMRARGF